MLKTADFEQKSTYFPPGDEPNSTLRTSKKLASKKKPWGNPATSRRATGFGLLPSPKALHSFWVDEEFAKKGIQSRGQGSGTCNFQVIFAVAKH